MPGRSTWPGWRPRMWCRSVASGKIQVSDVDAMLARWRDGAGADVGVEQAGVQHEELDKRGEADLAGLQDDVQIVHLLEQSLLRPVHAERHLDPMLVNHRIEVVQPPSPVRELVKRAGFHGELAVRHRKTLDF